MLLLLGGVRVGEAYSRPHHRCESESAPRAGLMGHDSCQFSRNSGLLRNTRLLNGCGEFQQMPSADSADAVARRAEHRTKSKKTGQSAVAAFWRAACLCIGKIDERWALGSFTVEDRHHSQRGSPK